MGERNGWRGIELAGGALRDVEGWGRLSGVRLAESEEGAVEADAPAVTPEKRGLVPVLQRAPTPWEEIALAVGGAIIASILLDVLVNPPAEFREFVNRVLGSVTRIAFALAVGAYLGARSWPKMGRKLGVILLRRAVKARVQPMLVLTDRPDFHPFTWRRILEVVGFAAGTTSIVTTILAITGSQGVRISLISNLFVLLALWGSFVLVPYWTFAGMGVRRVDPVRWIVEPLSRRYAQRMRLSNGALLLVALGLIVNLAFRAGASGEEAFVDGLRVLGHLVAAILVVAATAVAYYKRAERGVLLDLEAEALALGIRDGRSLSDGDFLPRVP